MLRLVKISVDQLLVDWKTKITNQEIHVSILYELINLRDGCRDCIRFTCVEMNYFISDTLYTYIDYLKKYY